MSAQLGLFDAPAPKQRRSAALSSFHARNESPAEALAGQARAVRQELLVVTLFRTMPAGARLTPSEVNYAFPKLPLTSVRRALTNLTARGLLRKHPEDRRPGPRGARECTWSLA